MASLGEEILELAQETRKDVATLRRLAEILAAPDEPTGFRKQGCIWLAIVNPRL